MKIGQGRHLDSWFLHILLTLALAVTVLGELTPFTLENLALGRLF
jgi:threonine/homoserine efflux transporter RhtA